MLREHSNCFAIALTLSPRRAITRISTDCSWVNINGAKAVILPQVGQIYFGAVGQYYIGVNKLLAQSETDALRLWAVRDSSGEFRAVFWPHVGFDISIPTGEIGRFMESLKETLKARRPDTQAVFFGHVGDSNVHIGVKVMEGAQPE